MKRFRRVRLPLACALVLLALPLPGAAAQRSRHRSKPAPRKATPSTKLAPATARPPTNPAGPAGTAAAPVTDLQLAPDVREGQPGARIVLTATLRDGSGRTRDAELRIDPDAGTAEAPVRASQGVYKVRLTLPTSLGSRRSLIVVASAGQAVATLSLPLVPGPAAALNVEAPPDLPADGANHPLWVTVTDAHGNPTADAPTVTVTSGELGEPVQMGAGEWMVDYRPPRSSRVRQESVSVRAGAAETTQPLPLTPVPARITASPRVGVVLGAGGPALALGADAALWVADLPPTLGLVAGVMWWGASDSSGVAGPGGRLELGTRRSWLPLTLSAAARQPLGTSGTLTLSLGGGTALVSSRTTLTGQPAVSESGWAPAAMVGVDLAFRTRFGAPFVEARAGWIGDPGLRTVRGSAWPVMFFLGSRFDAY